MCFIDFETTGIDVFRDEPLEFGAVLVNDNLDVIKEFHSKISPSNKVYLTKRAFNIHSLTIEELKDFPTQKEVAIDFFKDFGTDYRFAGWNISFDVSFMRKICHKNGLMRQFNLINHRHIDTQTIGFLATELEIVSFHSKSLNDWVDFFGLVRGTKHSALEDARLTLEVHRQIFKRFKSYIQV